MLTTEFYINNKYSILTKFAEHYGFEHQKLKLIEEMAELTQALLKGNIESIVEEMADVEILLDQIRYLIFSSSEGDLLFNTFKAAIDYKTKRQEARIQEEKRNGK